MVCIYILQLQNNKFYIGKTNNIDFRLEQHFDGNGSEFTKIYKPLNVVGFYPNCDDFDEDKFTIKTMAMYGIDNVRGGSFVQLYLDQNEINVIHKMINGAKDKCFYCSSSSHFVKDCPAFNKHGHCLDFFSNDTFNSITDNTLKKKLKNLFTHDSLANILQEEFGDKIIYIYEGDNKNKAERRIFSDNNWMLDDSIIYNIISNNIYNLLKSYYPDESAEPYLVKLLDYNYEKNIVRLHKNKGIYRNRDDFDNDPYIFAFKNKYYNLKTNSFFDRTPDDLILMTTKYDWIEPTDDELKQAHEILDRIFIEVDVKQLVLEILSTGLEGINLQKFILFIGQGRNGKGVIDIIMRIVLGDYYYSADNKLLVNEQKEGSGPNPELANMAKKRYVHYDEVPSKKLQNNIIRKITGGSNINARMCGQDKSEHKNFTTNVASTNDMPLFKDELKPSDIDRLLIIQFPNKFVDNIEDRIKYENMGLIVYDMDKEIEDKIKQLRCAFAKILIDANEQYHKRKHFFVPDSVKKMTNMYINEGSLLTSWLTDNFERTGNEIDFITLGSEYKNFLASCDLVNKEKYKIKRNFFNFFKEHKEYYIDFKEKYNYYKIDGNRSQTTNVLVGWKKLVLSDD